MEVKAKGSFVRDVVGDGCQCVKADPRSLGIFWVGVRQGMCLLVLVSKELALKQ